MVKSFLPAFERLLASFEVAEVEVIQLNGNERIKDKSQFSFHWNLKSCTVDDALFNGCYRHQTQPSVFIELAIALARLLSTSSIELDKYLPKQKLIRKIGKSFV